MLSQLLPALAGLLLPGAPRASTWRAQGPAMILVKEPDELPTPYPSDDEPLPYRCGLLCVGLGGNNGVTMLAAQIANRKKLTWESSHSGPKEANCLGCITQV